MGRTIIITITILTFVTGAWIADLVVARSHPADDMIAMAPINLAADWR